MVELKRIAGIFLLGFALFFAFRIQQHLNSSSAHEHSLVQTDIVLIFILAGAGLVLLFSRAQPGNTKPKKPNSRSLGLFGLFLILISLIMYRNVVLFLGKQTVRGSVRSVDAPEPLASGRAYYHVIYQYTDASGAILTGKDTVSSTAPILKSDPIEVTRSTLIPTVSHVSSRVRHYGVWTLGVGLLYELWALYLLMRPGVPRSDPVPA